MYNYLCPLFISLGHVHKSILTRLYDSSMLFFFFRNHHTFFYSVCTTLIFKSNGKVSNFSTFLTILIFSLFFSGFCVVFNNSHPNGCEVLSWFWIYPCLHLLLWYSHIIWNIKILYNSNGLPILKQHWRIRVNLTLSR